MCRGIWLSWRCWHWGWQSPGARRPRWRRSRSSQGRWPSWTSRTPRSRRPGQTQGHVDYRYALCPRPWLAGSLEHIPAITQQHYDYLVHDALIKPMPQGEFTYSLAEHAEIAADFTKAAFRLRPDLKFHDGHPLTTADVKWTYENYKGVNVKMFHDKLDRIEIVDDRTIIFHFKGPFIDFLDLLQWRHHRHWLDCPQALLRARGKGRVQIPPHRRRAL